MSNGLLLDTNIISHLVRQPAGCAAQRLREHMETRCCTSIIVACELRFGAEKSGSALLSERIDQILAKIEVLPLCTPVEHHYARLREALQRAGTPIGPNDMLIAAHALAHDLTLITDNVDEFLRVDGLRVENWIS